MDDGMQFAERKARTEVRFVVAATSKRGDMCFPIGQTENIEEIASVLAQAEARNTRWVGNSNYHIRVFLPEHKYINDSITMEEYQAMQPAVEEVEATSATSEAAEIVEEQAVEAAKASTDAVATDGKFEVIGEWACEPARTIYRGNSIKAAKAAVASIIGKCIHVYTKFEGVTLLYRAKEDGFYWDRSDQYREDMRAGKFNAAFERDWQADMEISPEARRRHALTLREMATPMPTPGQVTMYE